MKKIIQVVLVCTICSLLLLTACQGSTASVETTSNSQTVVDATQESAVPVVTQSLEVSVNTLDAFQLLFGILKLQGSQQAISVEQATALLPLWTNYQTLTGSMNPGGNPGGDNSQTDVTPSAPQIDSETQTQIDEILKQINSILTQDQVAAIQLMALSSDSSDTLMQELGITVQSPAQNADGTQPQGGGPGGGTPPDGSTPPDGGTPPDGSTPPDNGGTPPEMSGTPQAPQTGNGSMPSDNSRLNPAAISALIDYLLSITNA